MHLVLYDTEYTAWEGSRERQWSGENEFREIIQIAAVCCELTPNGLTLCESYNTLVTPIRNPQLSDYIIDLTGLDQATLDAEGIPAIDAIEGFWRFAQSGTIGCWSWGDDSEALSATAGLNNWPLPEFPGGFGDIRHFYRAAKAPVEQLQSGKLGKHYGLEISGSPHEAMYDVLCIFESINHLWADHPKAIAELKKEPRHD